MGCTGPEGARVAGNLVAQQRRLARPGIPGPRLRSRSAGPAQLQAPAPIAVSRLLPAAPEKRARRCGRTALRGSQRAFAGGRRGPLLGHRPGSRGLAVLQSSGATQPVAFASSSPGSPPAGAWLLPDFVGAAPSRPANACGASPRPVRRASRAAAGGRPLPWLCRAGARTRGDLREFRRNTPLPAPCGALSGIPRSRDTS